MKTKLLYLNEPKSDPIEAKLVNIHEINSKIGLIFDQTNMYPKGGGQLSDTARIIKNGLVRNISHVHYYNGDQVIHYVESGEKESFKIGDIYTLEINNQTRLLHSRLHSAGELICVALANLGYKPSMISSAKHWPGQSQIIVNTQLNQPDREQLKKKLEKEVSSLLEQNLKVKILNVQSRPEAIELIGYEPSYIDVHKDNIRLVMIGKHARPCMGTHVDYLSDLGEVIIRSVKKRKQETSISYDIKGSVAKNKKQPYQFF